MGRDSYNNDILWKTDPDLWGRESLHISETFVYKGITEGVAFSKEYVDAARKICLERLALGGYRLANTLKWAFKNEVQNIKERKRQYLSKSFYILKVKEA